MTNEWPLVLFTVLICLGAGTLIAVCACEWLKTAEKVRIPGAIVALITLPAGGFASMMHLGHPERMFGALGHPTSGIFTEALMIGLTMVGVIAYLVAFKKKAEDSKRRLIITVTSVLAAILAFAVGDTYVMASRPAWNTLMLPVAYLASAASMGVFCLFVLITLLEDTISSRIKTVALTVLGVQAVLYIAYLVAITVGPYSDVTRSARRVMTGDLAPLFWGGIVALGLVIPFLTVLKKDLTSNVVPFAFVGLAGTVIGALSFRILMFDLGTGVMQLLPGNILF